ncbi:shikimate kinase [Sulfuritalea hydrogenivorans sk43H]|uniref:Shikimate kinase n=1 Tax=Sulfuritalea hydrogenivorans sk43H TaxID=1223802 RepID=W0SB24_9PROT|nr:shikimate kinase [Sulfuritalea hydrogenivorans sk43H]
MHCYNSSVNAKNNIYLVGMPGAGKTTVGRQLARRMQRTFVDADHEIETRTGVRIPVIFDIEGEQGFRDRESRVIAELADESNLIVATGGGVVLRPQNRAALRQGGTVIYLHVAPRLLFERTRLDPNRPLLQVADPMQKIEELFAVRDPLYREVADIVITSTGGSISHLVKQLERELARQCAA